MMLTLNKYMMQMRETRGGQLGGRKRKIDADNHKYVIFNVIYVQGVPKKPSRRFKGHFRTLNGRESKKV